MGARGPTEGRGSTFLASSPLAGCTPWICGGCESLGTIAPNGAMAYQGLSGVADDRPLLDVREHGEYRSAKKRLGGAYFHKSYRCQEHHVRVHQVRERRRKCGCDGPTLHKEKIVSGTRTPITTRSSSERYHRKANDVGGRPSDKLHQQRELQYEKIGFLRHLRGFRVSPAVHICGRMRPACS